MSDELTRLLDLPAVARLLISDGELQVLTISHESADKVTIERRKLGTSIDLADLLGIVGAHGLQEPQVQIAEMHAPQLVAPVEEQTATPESEPESAPEPEAKPERPPMLACPVCQRAFINEHALDVHYGRAHPAPKQPTVDPVRARVERRKHTREHKPDQVVCPHCNQQFHQRGIATHIAFAHKQDIAAQAERVLSRNAEVTITPAERVPDMGVVAPDDDAPSKPVLLVDAGLCDTCRKPLSMHVRCRDCTLPLGQGHQAGPVHIVYNNLPYCSNCWAFRSAAPSFGIDLRKE